MLYVFVILNTSTMLGINSMKDRRSVIAKQRLLPCSNLDFVKQILRQAQDDKLIAKNIFEAFSFSFHIFEG